MTLSSGRSISDELTDSDDEAIDALAELVIPLGGLLSDHVHARHQFDLRFRESRHHAVQVNDIIG